MLNVKCDLLIVSVGQFNWHEGSIWIDRDCVINEAVGVIGRRAEEQRRSDQFEHLLDGLLAQVPALAITWISGAGERLFPELLAPCRQHQGKLNYHDALLVLACRELGVSVIVSFDGDFDSIFWLERLFEPASVIGQNAGATDTSG